MRSLSLSIDDPNANSGALSENQPLPGTWVSGFAFDDDGNIVLARNNVPVLEVLSPTGHLLNIVSLPPGVVSVFDMNLNGGNLNIIPGPTAGEDASVPSVYGVGVKGSKTLSDVPLRSSAGGLIDVFFPNGEEIRTDFEGDSTWIEGGSITTIQLAEQTLQVASPLGGISDVTAKDRVSGAGLGESGGLWLLLAALGGGTDLAQLT